MTRVAERYELYESEDDRVYAWRYETLLREGLDDDQASIVAAGSFDLHRARGMLALGCTPEQLVGIAGG